MYSQLIALYELKRQSFLVGYIQNPDHFSDALAYAYYHRIAPVFHEDIARETYAADPFEEVYAVKSDFINDVLKYVDDRWRDDDLKAVAFAELEIKFGGYRTNRIELIRTLGYARIDGRHRFDDKLWAAIENRAPCEASSIDAMFSPKDVEFD